MPDPQKQDNHQNAADDGYLRACEGILRTQFGRRRFDVTARAIEQLKTDEQDGVGAAFPQSSSNWRETLTILAKGWLSWGSAVAVLTIGLGALLLWTVRFRSPSDANSLPKGRQSVKKEDPSKLLDRAFDLLKQTNYQAAETVFRRVLDLAPTDPEAHYGLGEIRRGEKKFDEASQLFQTALKLSPVYGAPHRSLGLIYKMQAQPAEAVRELKEAIRLDPKDPTARVNLANVLLETDGDLNEAEQLCRKALELSQDSTDALDVLASIRMRQRDFLAAEQFLRRAASLEPKSSEIQNDLGEVLRARGELDQAQKAYENALRLDPENIAPYANLAILHASRRNFPEAEKMFREVLKRSDATMRSLALVNLASVCGELDKLEEAENLFRQALTLAPDDPRIANAFASFLGDHLVKLDEALSLATRAVQTEPNNPEFLDILGWTQAQRGDLAGAEKTLKKALDLAGQEPPAPDIREHMKKVAEKRRTAPK